jgi:nucleoside-diphosphate-sugar epimerase
MKVLVAGGAGFVGSHVCRQLLDSGHEVICLDNELTGSRLNVADLLGNPRFQFVSADASDAPPIGADLILHLASPASPVDYNRMPLETLAANSTGTRRLLELAAAADSRFVYASTSEVYGDPLVHPQPESYWGNVDPIGPRACYDEAKRFGEALVTSWRRVHGVHAAIVRIFNTYGPAMRLEDGRVIPELLRAAFDGGEFELNGDGRQTRSFMHVDDLVNGLLLVGLDPFLDGLVVNIGNPDEVTINELVRRVEEVFGHEIPIRIVPARLGDPRQRQPDITRMRQRYGWSPRIGLEEGLRATYSWYADRRPAVSLVKAAG